MSGNRDLADRSRVSVNNPKGAWHAVVLLRLFTICEIDVVELELVAVGQGIDDCSHWLDVSTVDTDDLTLVF